MSIRWVIAPIQYRIHDPGDGIVDWDGTPMLNDQSIQKTFQGRLNRRTGLKDLPYVERMDLVTVLAQKAGTGITGTSTIASGGQRGKINDWALVFVRTTDLAFLDKEVELVDVLERDYEADDGFLATTPNSDGWDLIRYTAMIARLNIKGTDTSLLTMDSPFWEILGALGRVIQPENFIDIPNGRQNIFVDPGFATSETFA